MNNDNEKQAWLKIRERISPLDTVPTATTVDRAIREAVDRLELPRYGDPNKNIGPDLPSRKTCSKCASPSRDDPCEKCYNLFRASEGDKPIDELRPCMSCGERLTKYIYCDECENYLI